MALQLQLQKTPVEIGERKFVLVEMSGAQQSEFYALVNEVAQAQKDVNTLVQSAEGDPDKDALAKANGVVESANLRLWRMMLRPTDGQGEISSDWVRDNTNSRIGEAVINEQLSLNKFEDTMGKLMTQAQRQAQALGQDAAPPVVDPGVTPGPIFAAQ